MDKILVVEDDKTVYSGIKKLLELQHYSVVIAQNGMEALEKIDELFSIENYKKILENKEVPKRIKECIELYLECNKVCKELETIIIKKD